MARGFGARETTVALKLERLGSLPKAKALADGVKLILSDKSLKDDFLRLTKGIAQHVSNAGAFSKEVYAKADELEKQHPEDMQGAKRLGVLRKLGKLEIAETIKRLPASIRSLIEIDKANIAKMFRGVKDREIKEIGGWSNGQFVYGFTTDKKVAAEFSDAGRTMKDHDGVISGSKDVESVGGIIDPRRFAAVFNALFDKLPESEYYDGWLDAKYFGGKEYYDKEKEYIAYDVKLRKDGDKFYTS